jgi:hypothetical protein
MDCSLKMSRSREEAMSVNDWAEFIAETNEIIEIAEGVSE